MTAASDTPPEGPPPSDAPPGASSDVSPDVPVDAAPDAQADAQAAPAPAAPTGVKAALWRVWGFMLARAPGRPRGDLILIATYIAVIAYYRATRGIFEGKASGDGLMGFYLLPGTLLHHTFDLSVPAPHYERFIGRSITGLVGNPCPIGPSALWVPTYLLGLLWQHLANALHAHRVMAWIVPLTRRGIVTGQGEIDFWFAGLGTLVAGLIGVRLLYALVERRLGQGAARIAVGAAVFTTPLFWYLTNQPLYQHGCSFFGAILLIERWDAWRGAMTPRRWAGLGALGGVAALMRQQEVLFLILPGLDLLADLWQAARRRDGRGAARALGYGVLMGVAALAVYMPQLLLWKFSFGAWVLPKPRRYFLFDNPAIVESLLSMKAGLLPWVPSLYLAVPGLVLARRQLNGLVWRLGVMFLVELYLNASVWDYHGCWGFGPRRYTDAVGTLGLGVAGLYVYLRAQGPRIGRIGPRVLWGALLLLIAWNSALTELMRMRKIHSAGVGAFSGAVWVRWAGGPLWLERLFQRVGYPFVQPFGWAFAAAYHAPAAAFEGTIGNYALERDWRDHRWILTPGLDFRDGSEQVVEGVLRPPEGGWSPGVRLIAAAPRVRVLLGFMAREPAQLTLVGRFPGLPTTTGAPDLSGPVRVLWNGHPLPVSARADQIEFKVPEELVRKRFPVNELVYEGLPAGAQVERLRFSSLIEWWMR